MDLGEITGETGQIWILAKWFYLAAFGVYLIFSVIVWRQIVLMARTLNGVLEVSLKVMGLGLMAGAAVGFVWAMGTL